MLRTNRKSGTGNLLSAVVKIALCAEIQRAVYLERVIQSQILFQADLRVTLGFNATSINKTIQRQIQLAATFDIAFLIA